MAIDVIWGGGLITNVVDDRIWDPCSRNLLRPSGLSRFVPG